MLHVVLFSAREKAYSSSSESEEETAAEKKLRLAKHYISQIEQEGKCSRVWNLIGRMSGICVACKICCLTGCQRLLISLTTFVVKDVFLKFVSIISFKNLIFNISISNLMSIRFLKI